MKESMKALCADIEAAGEKELARAAKKYGATNNSPHESYAVIKEEFEEAMEETAMFDFHQKKFLEAVKKNKVNEQVERLQAMMEAARNAAAEWTQAYAMCVKALKKKDH